MSVGSKFLTATAVTLGASSAAFGQNLTPNWDPSGEGCVDTKGFFYCYDNQGSKAASSLDLCNDNNQKGTQAYQNCVMGFTSEWLAGNLGCWIQSC
jgi:hypothetical protein